MAAVSVDLEDLAPFADIEPAKAQAMIDDAVALAARVAPCILEETFAYEAAALAVLRGAILRWHESGTASYQAQYQGPPGYPVNPQRERRNLLWPSEIEVLEGLCRDASATSRAAFSVDTVAGGVANHSPICSLFFGGSCSCGADLTAGAYPLYEV